MKSLHFSKLSLLGTFLFTVIALINKEITVFYMLYLFWWQALIEILTHFGFQLKNNFPFNIAWKANHSAFFLMGLYFVFIVILFGIVFSFSNFDLFALNAQILVFRNIPFALNVILSLSLALTKLFTQETDEGTDAGFGFFSTKMIILHISIILGAFIHFGIKHYYPETFEDSIYPYILSAVPFLLLRAYVDWKMKE